MNEALSLVADLSPVLLFLAFVITVLLMIRLARRVSRGTESAGPRTVEQPPPVGLRITPWEVEAIDRQLQSRLDSPARRDLVSTVNRLSSAALQHEAIDEHIAPLPIDADNGRIASVVARLERRMELNPAAVRSAPGQPGR